MEAGMGSLPSVDEFIRYEGGEMTFEQEVDFFQALIDSGVVWELQGAYGRRAFGLITMGWCHDSRSGVGDYASQ